METTRSESRQLHAPQDGSVIVTVKSRVAEREITEERENIIISLHAAYLNLVDHMSEFQRHWDENPALAFIESAREGGNAGGADWLNDQKELFTAELWTDLGGKIKEAAGTTMDRLDSYRKARFEEIRQAVNEVGDPEDTICNWAWWQTVVSKKVHEVAAEQKKRLADAEQMVSQTMKTVLAQATMAKKIYEHRDAILELPNLIANGQPKPIQAFVDTVIFDIDPALARQIKNDPNFANVLEVIADHDSALSYLAYVGLMLEAVPPNFYAYLAGKGAAYLMIEVVLLIVSALLSAGTALVARVTMLVGRLAGAGVKAVSANRRIKRARAAIEAFVRLIEDLSAAAQDLRNLGAKLVQARSHGLVIKGPTRVTMSAKKGAIKRDKRCKMCGSAEHSTPRGRLGVVEYE